MKFKILQRRNYSIEPITRRSCTYDNISKNRLREEHNNIADLLRRLITRYYYIRKFAPLIGFITQLCMVFTI